jgi:hypothetical protein
MNECSASLSWDRCLQAQPSWTIVERGRSPVLAPTLHLTAGSVQLYVSSPLLGPRREVSEATEGGADAAVPRAPFCLIVGAERQ